MHPQLTLIVAQERIADLLRAAAHDRIVHTATSSHAVAVPRHAAAPVSFLRWLRRDRSWTSAAHLTVVLPSAHGQRGGRSLHQRHGVVDEDVCPDEAMALDADLAGDSVRAR